MAHDICNFCLPDTSPLPEGAVITGWFTVPAEGGWWGDERLGEGRYVTGTYPC
jgi:hypothetical protein